MWLSGLFSRRSTDTKRKSFSKRLQFLHLVFSWNPEKVEMPSFLYLPHFPIYFWFFTLLAPWSLLPLTPCSQYTRCPPANTTSPCSGVPSIWNHQRKEKIKIVGKNVHAQRWKHCWHQWGSNKNFDHVFVLHLLQTLGFVSLSKPFSWFQSRIFCEEREKVPAFKCIGQHFHEKPALYRIFI